MNKISHFFRGPGLAACLTLLVTQNHLFSSSFLERTQQAVRTTALYGGLGAAGLLSAPVAYDLAKKYHKPIFEVAKNTSLRTMRWSKNNPKKALWSSLLLSGAVYFGLPHVGTVSNIVAAHTIAQGKAWTVWDSASHLAYQNKLEEQKAFAEDLRRELYQIYLATARSLNLHEVVEKLERKIKILPQIEARKNAATKAVKTVSCDGTTKKITGTMACFGRISEKAKSLGWTERLKNIYTLPLWMESFASPEEALVAYVGNDLIGDINALFAKFGTIQDWDNINYVLRAMQNQSNTGAHADMLRKAERLFAAVLKKTEQFIDSRQYRLDALKRVSFKK